MKLPFLKNAYNFLTFAGDLDKICRKCQTLAHSKCLEHQQNRYVHDGSLHYGDNALIRVPFCILCVKDQ
jgi:hypothetical protein